MSALTAALAQARAGTRTRVAATVLRGLVRYGRAHRAWFFKGTLAALAVVAGRLSLPLPLKSLTDLWAGEAAAAWLPAALDPALALGSAFLLLILLLGGADHVERFCFARFSIATANDLRAAALAAVLARADARPATGDLLARLVGDTGRVKSGVDSFLVQVATNGAVFAGMTVVLAVIEPLLGLAFVAAGLAIAAVTAHAAARVLAFSLAHREREGDFANRVRDALDAETDGADIRRGEAGQEAQVTHAQGVATWATHAIFGAAVLAALAAGSHAIAAGRIGVADMVLFMMYALTMRGPLVRLARQGAKSGRIVAAGHRLLQLIEPAATKTP